MVDDTLETTRAQETVYYCNVNSVAFMVALVKPGLAGSLWTPYALSAT